MANGELPEGARDLWRLSRGELAGWTELEHDRLRLERVLAARRSDARAFFAGVAGEWDRLRTELYGDRFTAEALPPSCRRTGWSPTSPAAAAR